MTTTTHTAHEIRPVRHDEDGGIVWADEAQAEMFGVYEAQGDGTHQWVADCVDRDTARRVASGLEGVDTDGYASALEVTLDEVEALELGSSRVGDIGDYGDLIDAVLYLLEREAGRWGIGGAAPATAGAPVPDEPTVTA